MDFSVTLHKDLNKEISSMKHRNLTIFIMAVAMAIVTASAVLMACSNNSNEFVFQTPQEAVKACHKELSNIRPMKKASMKELSIVTARWITLQDSTFAIMMRDSTIDSNSDVAADFFATSDSIRNEIARLALSEDRSLSDVVYYKVHTARNREKIQESKDYENAVAFYNDLDRVPTYKTVGESVKNYEALLQKNNGFNKEEELLQFIKEEDKCFRSIMEHLYEVKQADLEHIADRTAMIFQKLYERSQVSPENPVSARLVMYISMRFNRRILQNAEAVVRDIKKEKELSEQQAANYRWMILQPFMTIDTYSMASITDSQEKKLKDIAEQLPRLLAYIDGKDFDKSEKSETEKLPGILTRYFLKSYLRQVL